MGCCGDQSCDRPVVRCTCDQDCWLDYAQNDYAVCSAGCKAAGPYTVNGELELWSELGNVGDSGGVCYYFETPAQASCGTARSDAIQECSDTASACTAGCGNPGDPGYDACTDGCSSAQDSCNQAAATNYAACMSGAIVGDTEALETCLTNGANAFSAQCGIPIAACLRDCELDMIGCRVPKATAVWTCYANCYTTNASCTDPPGDFGYCDRQLSACGASCQASYRSGEASCLPAWRSCRGSCGNEEFARSDPENGKEAHCGGALYSGLVGCEGNRDGSQMECGGPSPNNATSAACLKAAEAAAYTCRWEKCLEAYPTEYEANGHERALCEYTCVSARLNAEASCGYAQGTCETGCEGSGDVLGCIEDCQTNFEVCVATATAGPCGEDCTALAPDCVDCALIAGARFVDAEGVPIPEGEWPPIHWRMLGVEPPERINLQGTG